jgi:uncharacterized protein
MKNGIRAMLTEKVRNLWRLEQEQPLQVSVMGQTGVGKSSLVNTLFGANFKVSSTRPETLEPQKLDDVVNGHKIEFWDLPGLGETTLHDEQYLAAYKSRLHSSHVVIWAIHADSRSFSFDRTALEKLLASFPDRDQKIEVMNKIIFVLTKVDLLTPSPWVLAKMGIHGVFTAHGKTEELLAEKEQYFQEALVAHFSSLLKAQTFHGGNFTIKDDHLEYDEYSVTYTGWLSKSRFEELNKRHPEHREVFTRLYNAHRVIPCSSSFHFHLDLLMQVIVDKLAPQAIASFEHFQPRENALRTLSFTKAKYFRNMIILDTTQQKIYDLTTIDHSLDGDQ